MSTEQADLSLKSKVYEKTLGRIRFYLTIFFLGILFTLHIIIFIEAETAFLINLLGHSTFFEKNLHFVSSWMENLHLSVIETHEQYPVMAYFMDWLAYTCIIFAILIIGAIKDPIKNIWIIQTYMLACLLAAALPLIVGPVRNIPVFWRIIDISFSLTGFLILLLAYRLIKRLQNKDLK